MGSFGRVLLDRRRLTWRGQWEFVRTTRGSRLNSGQLCLARVNPDKPQAVDPEQQIQIDHPRLSASCQALSAAVGFVSILAAMPATR